MIDWLIDCCLKNCFPNFSNDILHSCTFSFFEKKMFKIQRSAYRFGRDERRFPDGWEWDDVSFAAPGQRICHKRWDWLSLAHWISIAVYFPPSFWNLFLWCIFSGTTEEEGYPCAKCDRVFKHIQQLRGHQAAHVSSTRKRRNRQMGDLAGLTYDGEDLDGRFKIIKGIEVMIKRSSVDWLIDWSRDLIFCWSNNWSTNLNVRVLFKV